MKEIKKRLPIIELTPKEDTSLFYTLYKLQEIGCNDIVTELSQYLCLEYFDKIDIVTLFQFLHFIPTSIATIAELLVVYKIMTTVNANG